MVLVNFWRYPDPYQRFLIRIRPNDTDPTGSGSETLVKTNQQNLEIKMTIKQTYVYFMFSFTKSNQTLRDVLQSVPHHINCVLWL